MKRQKLTLFFYFIALNSICFSQTSSSSDGNWSTGGNWTAGVPETDEVVTITNNMTIDQDIEVDTDGSYTINGGTAIDPTGGSDYNLVVQGTGYFEVRGNVTFGGELNLKNNADIVVKGCDTLTIGGNVVLENNSNLTVESCAVLIIKGNLEMKNNLGMVINGQVKVEGDLDASNNAAATGTGNFQVDGSTSFANGSNLFGETTTCSDCDFGGGNPLPIELLSFSVYPKSSSMLEVIWQTATEINNHYFTIEYSLNGSDYYEGKRIIGAGNSQSKLEYQTEIFVGTASIVYVRLKQTDYDGKFEIFEPKAASMNQAKAENENSFTLTNNPGSGERVRLITPQSLNDFELRIIDISGKELFRASKQFQSLNTNEIKLPNLSNYGKGIYFIQLISNQIQTQEAYLVQ